MDVILAQTPRQPSPNPVSGVSGFNTQQLDALLAPIALYPDALLTQILMASTFPLQVVEAARWHDDPANGGLSGDALNNSLARQPWDPSVKSLVPFPQVLAMMNGNLEWTQQLGYAFADQQAAVLQSVQRLRQQAQTKGSLKSTSQQTVRNEQQIVIIEPVEPSVVYVPTYDPSVVYGTWPYPTYPPVYLPPQAAYPVATAFVSGLAFGAGVAVTAGLWNWAHPDWHGGNVNINVNRYNSLNFNRTAIRSNVWQANRPGGHPAGLVQPPRGPVGQPQRSNGMPANAIGRSQVAVPRSAVAPSTEPAAMRRPAQPSPGGGTGSRQAIPGRQSTERQQTASPTAFSGINDGRQARQFGERGAQSRSIGQAQRSPHQAGSGFSGVRPSGHFGPRR